MLLDESLKVIANEQRRTLLYTLKDLEENTASYDELTDRMIKENRMKAEEKEMFTLSMIHQHLPKISEAGLAEYDKGTETIRYVEDEDFEDLLKTVEELERKQDF